MLRNKQLYWTRQGNNKYKDYK